MSLAPGTHIGPYEVVGALGAGGMGEVYRARDLSLHRDVAIKVLPAGTASDPGARERLRSEARAAAALDHPYVCKVYEIREHAESLCLVMEYVAGETLQRRLQSGPMSFSEALRVAGQMADALEFAHEQGIIHRDLKPANIMLTAQGHVKIMDFGLAKRVTLAADSDAATIQSPGQLTAPGTVLGTPDYMSPEQAKGLPLDARSDLFSFGVIFAEMVGGRHPFRRQTTVETFSAVLRDPPEFAPAMPPQTRLLLARMLAKEPGDRPASAAAIRADLARLDPASGSRHVDDRRRASRHWIWVVGAIVLAVVSGAVVWPRLRDRTVATSDGSASRPTIRSIAVLPLDNYSGDAAQDYFAEGMTDELTANLATISRLRVISRGSVMQFKGKTRPPARDIAKLLDVDALVEGSVTRVGERVRITAELVDARADRHLWARTFERSSRDVLALQAELASAVAGEINVQLTPAEASRLAEAPAVNPEAHDAYLKGRYFFNRPSDENLKKAIAQFEEAVRLNPESAPAWSGLSDAALWAGYNEGFMTASEGRSKARQAAQKAVQLDDRSAEAHASLATFKVFYEHDWVGAEREYRRAFELNSNYAFAHDQFSLALALQGRLEESIVEGRRAAELDPLSPQIPIDQTIPFMFKGDFDTARALARKAAELDPGFFFAPFLTGWANVNEGKVRDAIPELQRARGMDAPAFVTAWLGYAYGRSGDRAAATGELVELKKRSLRNQPTAFNLAIVHLGLGEHAQAIALLERAYAEDSQWLGWLGMDRMFDPLRSEPRFVELLKKLRLERARPGV